MKSFAVTFMLLAALVYSFAAGTNNPSPITMPVQVAPEPSTGSALEISLLRQEIQLQKTFQDNILKTVFYSLGTVGTIALLLVGYNWWSANKIYDRDKTALKESILNTQKDAYLTFKGEVTELLNSAVAAANERNQRLHGEISEKLAAGLAATEEKYLKFNQAVLEKINAGSALTEEKYLKFSQGVSEKLNAGLNSTEEKYLKLRDETGKALQTFRVEIDEQLRAFIKTSLSDLESRLGQKVEKAAQKQKADIDGLRTDLLRINYDLNEKIAKDHEEKGYWGSAYTFYFDTLGGAIELNWEFFITRAFDNVIRCLRKGATVTKREKTAAADLMKKVPEKYQAQVAAFSELVVKAPGLSNESAQT